MFLTYKYSDEKMEYCYVTILAIREWDLGYYRHFKIVIYVNDDLN